MAKTKSDFKKLLLKLWFYSIKWHCYLSFEKHYKSLWFHCFLINYLKNEYIKQNNKLVLDFAMASLKLYYQREMPQKAKMCFHVWRQSSYFCLSGLLALPRKEFFAYVSEVSYSPTMEEVEPRMEGWKHMKSLLNLWDSGSRRYLRRSSDLIINYQLSICLPFRSHHIQFLWRTSKLSMNVDHIFKTNAEKTRKERGRCMCLCKRWREEIERE